jgi:hypothetical protein
MFRASDLRYQSFLQTLSKSKNSVHLEKMRFVDVAVGRRVKVVIMGPYRGRVGVVVSRRGTMYWDVQLDETERDVSRLIYKMSSSLKVIEE